MKVILAGEHSRSSQELEVIRDPLEANTPVEHDAAKWDIQVVHWTYDNDNSYLMLDDSTTIRMYVMSKSLLGTKLIQIIKSTFSHTLMQKTADCE